MYRPGKPAHGPPSFGSLPPHGPPFRLGGPCSAPPSGHLPPGPCGPFLASTPDGHFLHNRPRGHFIRHYNMNSEYSQPHCSSFTTDRNTGIALGGRQQIVPPAEPSHTQVPQWNPSVEHHPPDSSDQAGEEFLRCIAANKPLPDYLKGNMAYNLADAFKSANVLKEAVKSDPEFQKHMIRSKSRSRSCGRSRGLSRGRSRGKSRAKSRASDKRKKTVCVPVEHRHQHHDSQENSALLENDSMVLPHDRVGNDFSWLQAQSQEDSTVQKADELEDEESFLYGNEDIGGKQTNKSSTMLFKAFSQIGEQATPQERDSPALGSQCHQTDSMFSGFGDHTDPKQPLQMTSSSLASANLDSSECEKIKNILKSLGTTNISEIMVTMKGQKEEKQLSPAPVSSDPTAAGLALPVLSNPNVRQALESLQSLIKATKEKRTKGDGCGTSQTSSNTHKAGDDEEKRREKQARMTKMESLMKELEGLMKVDGLSFLTPVIGFYCQKCEEFIGDFSSAENHAATHCHSNSSNQNVHLDKHAGDGKGHSQYSSSSNQHSHHSDRRDHRDSVYHRDSGEHRNHRNYERDRIDERDHRSKHDSHHRSHRAGLENISLKEEMRKERMLITVSRGVTPPPNVEAKEEVKMENVIGSHNKVKVEDTDSKGKSSMDSREKNNIKDESSDSSDDDKGKTSKAKSPKKKKKKKEKKKKKKEKGRKGE
ncbi:hypothetical protein L3Q82_011576 [Scortum barcoo]|uniref:Uncharacterized protein n=1 Tax=Scortum barcoo TaxID=214431 RepID=A0ACB8W6Y9_9TELE|nr:hypothetical protein L3Q82_011576 [Scortum barcoo]